MECSEFNYIILINFTGCWYTFKEYKNLKDNPIQPHGISPNLNALFQSYLEKSDTWLILLIISAVVTVIILLILLVLRKRIVIAIALIKEGSK